MSAGSGVRRLVTMPATAARRLRALIEGDTAIARLELAQKAMAQQMAG